VLSPVDSLHVGLFFLFPNVELTRAARSVRLLPRPHAVFPPSKHRPHRYSCYFLLFFPAPATCLSFTKSDAAVSASTSGDMDKPFSSLRPGTANATVAFSFPSPFSFSFRRSNTKTRGGRAAGGGGGRPHPPRVSTLHPLPAFFRERRHFVRGEP
jgi:hypothetical protein